MKVRLIACAAASLACVALTACAPQAARATDRAARTAEAACDNTGPVSASFTSAADGWLLAVTSPGCAAIHRVVLDRTTDDGRHWVPVSTLPGPWGINLRAGGVSQVVFANSRDGWAYGPALWATHDGGRHWRPVAPPGGAVQSLATAAGYAVAILGPTRLGQGFTVATAPVGTDRWRTVQNATGAGQGAVVVAGHTAYATASSPGPGHMGRATMLTGSVSDPRSWHRRVLPCPAAMHLAIATAAADAQDLVLACASIGMHPEPVTVYRSADGGATWRRLSTVALDDPPTSVSVAPNGTILLTGIYNGLLISRDGGRTWHPVPAVDGSGPVQGGTEISAQAITDDDMLAIVQLHAMWLSYNAGRTWHS